MKHTILGWNTFAKQTQEEILRTRLKIRHDSHCCFPWPEDGSQWAICSYHEGFEAGVRASEEGKTDDDDGYEDGGY